MNDENQSAIEAEELDVVESTEAEAVETEGEKPQESQPEEKDNSVQKRINEITKSRREAERERDYWKQKALEKPKEDEQIEVKTLEDFDFNEPEYIKHLINQSKTVAAQEARKLLQEEQEVRTNTRRMSDFRARSEEFASTVEDYKATVSNEGLHISEAMADVAMDMEDGPSVLYYLGKNPDIAERIAMLSPLQAAREMGRIEAKLAIKTETVSKAPPPTPKIAGNDAAIRISASSADSNKLPADEWRKLREKQLRGK